MNLQEAIERTATFCPNEYARVYAETALKMNPNDDAFHTQLLYVRSNLSTWRGDEARQVRATIDEALDR